MLTALMHPIVSLNNPQQAHVLLRLALLTERRTPDGQRNFSEY